MPGTADAQMARLKLTFFAPWGKLPSYIINPREPSELKKRADTGSLNLSCRPLLSRREGKEILE